MDFIEDNYSRDVIQKCETIEFQNELRKVLEVTKKNVYEGPEEVSPPEYLEPEKKFSKQSTDLEFQIMERLTSMEEQLAIKSEESKKLAKLFEELQEKQDEIQSVKIKKHSCHWYNNVYNHLCYYMGYANSLYLSECKY